MRLEWEPLNITSGFTLYAPELIFCKKAGLSLGASHRAFKVVLTVL